MPVAVVGWVGASDHMLNVEPDPFHDKVHILGKWDDAV